MICGPGRGDPWPSVGSRWGWGPGQDGVKRQLHPHWAMLIHSLSLSFPTGNVGGKNTFRSKEAFCGKSLKTVPETWSCNRRGRSRRKYVRNTEYVDVNLCAEIPDTLVSGVRQLSSRWHARGPSSRPRCPFHAVWTLHHRPPHGQACLLMAEKDQVHTCEPTSGVTTGYRPACISGHGERRPCFMNLLPPQFVSETVRSARRTPHRREAPPHSQTRHAPVTTGPPCLPPAHATCLRERPVPPGL